MNIKELLKCGNNRIYRLILILLAGICLMIVVWPTGDRSGQSGKKSDTQGTADTWSSITGQADDTDISPGSGPGMEDTSVYTEYMEGRLATILSEMGGISDVSVMLTVRDSGQQVTLKDTDTSRSEADSSSQVSITEETVMRDDGSVTEPYVTQYREPEIEGVVVCCRGAENGETTLKITRAVQALFDVPTHKIVILEAN